MIDNFLTNSATTYTSYDVDGRGKITVSGPLSISCRVGIESRIETDSQGENKYNYIFIHTDTELKQGYCVEYNGIQYEIRNVTKTYNIASDDYFFYAEGIEQSFTLSEDEFIDGGQSDLAPPDTIDCGTASLEYETIIDGGDAL